MKLNFVRAMYSYFLKIQRQFRCFQFPVCNFNTVIAFVEEIYWSQTTFSKFVLRPRGTFVDDWLYYVRKTCFWPFFFLKKSNLTPRLNKVTF